MASSASAAPGPKRSASDSHDDRHALQQWLRDCPDADDAHIPDRLRHAPGQQAHGGLQSSPPLFAAGAGSPATRTTGPRAVKVGPLPAPAARPGRGSPDPAQARPRLADLRSTDTSVRITRRIYGSSRWSMLISTDPDGSPLLCLSSCLPFALIAAPKPAGSVRPRGSLANGITGRSPGGDHRDCQGSGKSTEIPHMVGVVANSRLRVALNLYLANGRGGRGTESFGAGRCELLTLGDVAYINCNAAYFAGGPIAGGSKFAGKWLRAPATSGNHAMIASLTVPHQVVAGAVTRAFARRSLRPEPTDWRPMVRRKLCCAGLRRRVNGWGSGGWAQHSLVGQRASRNASSRSGGR